MVRNVDGHAGGFLVSDLGWHHPLPSQCKHLLVLPSAIGRINKPGHMCIINESRTVTHVQLPDP
jgi:hypothetical protein